MANNIFAPILRQPQLPPVEDQLLADQLQQSQPVAPQDDPENQSLLRRIASGALSGIGAVGNLLDLPGSMLRDVVSLHNPFDQLLTPFSPENRQTGRDVLTSWGVAKPNDPNKWEAADFGGFGLELALDPLIPLKLGTKALTKGAGEIASHSGLLDDVARVAPKQMGRREANLSTTLGDLVKPRAGEVALRSPLPFATGADMPDRWKEYLTAIGNTPEQIDNMNPRDAERTIRWIDGGIRQYLDDWEPLVNPRNASDVGPSTMQDVGKAWDIERGRKASQAAESLGINLEDVLNEPVGTVARYDIPFGGPSYELGTGDTGMKIAKTLDKYGRKIVEAKIPGTDFQPLAQLQALFRPSVAEATQRTLRERVMPDIHAGRQEAEAKARGEMSDILYKAQKADVTPQNDVLDAMEQSVAGDDVTREAMQSARGMDDRRKLRRMFEGIDAPDTPEMGDLHNAVRRSLDNRIPEAQDWGVDVGELVDEQAKYFPRGKTKEYRGFGNRGQARYVTARDATTGNREPFLKDLGEGTDTITQIATDQEISNLIKAKAKPDVIAEKIKQKYGNQVPETYLDKGEEKDRYKTMAEWLIGTPEDVRKTGIFGNHPFQDLEARLVGFHQSLDTAKRIITNLADPKTMEEARRFSTTPNETIPIGDLFQSLKLKPDDATRKMLQLSGVANPDAELIKAARKYGVPRDFAEQLMRVDQAFKGPQAATGFLKAFDDATGIFKMGVLTWPSRYVRDLVSGQFQNHLSGMWSKRAAAEAHAVTLGKGADIADIPAVRDQLRKMGLEPNQKNAADAVRALAYKHKVVGSMEPVLEGGADNGGSTLKEMIGRFPGSVYGNAGKAFDPISQAKHALKGGETTWNPLKAHYRGVGEATESTFAPAAAGDVIGHYTDSMNRLTPFIDQLRKGVDPAEAAKRVRAAQVDYSSAAQTRFTREVMGRIFPFWKFTSGAMPYTLTQLWEQPGGRLAQVVRASNRASGSDATTPEYIADTASIPLGSSEDGTDRYVTGFGLMHEDPLSFFGQGVRGVGMDALGRMNPIIKAPLEWSTGESFFQKGPQGGRDLTDLDPSVGRTLANVVGSKEPVTFPGSDALEFILANSPLARALSTTRTLTDPRKTIADKAVNLLSGVRIADVSPAAQDAVLRERVQQAMRESGAKSFNRVYFPSDRLEGMSDGGRQNAEQMQGLIDDLAERAKARKAVKALKGE